MMSDARSPAAGSSDTARAVSATFLTSGELRATAAESTPASTTWCAREVSSACARDGTSAADAPRRPHSARRRLGGRLDCISLLSAHWACSCCGAIDCIVQFDVGASRLPPSPAGVKRHWRKSPARPARACAADLVEALAQACRCQEPRAAIATLDSAWHLGLIDEAGHRRRLRAAAAAISQALRPLLDPRSESGTETLHAADSSHVSAAPSNCRCRSMEWGASTFSSTDG